MINVMPGGVARSSQTKQARKSPEPKGNQEQTAAGSKKKKNKKKNKNGDIGISLFVHTTDDRLLTTDYIRINLQELSPAMSNVPSIPS
jgi:hypothetical protein